ncbi:BspA family leucine-rich repeat surface protein [Lacticaseibacillus hegangensis]|uniref:BspA family leucine-rich repeat surface protein n=1 Tax=Lacticaseibacillus hegangensis TaxID=2486010 RepID=A0ABW4D079_9LACO|nr:BspA family leucine-rich repeat surface protein [Lacticaseibacillus hegangensis]
MTDRRASWWLRLRPVILTIMLCMMASFSAPKSVQAAAWNQAAYNSASVKGTWKVVGATGIADGGTVGGPKYYLDNSGTLHFGPATKPIASTVSSTVDAGTSHLSSNAANVKAISFDGSNFFVDQTNGFFQQFENLETITGLENVDVSQMTNMSFLFSGESGDGNANKMPKLTTISGLSNWDVSHVTTMADMFQKNPVLTHVDGIANWDTSAVTDMNHLFYGDTSMSTLPDLSAWKTNRVTDFDFAFSGMTNLTEVTSLNNWDVSSGVKFWDMFSNDPALTTLNIQQWNPQNAEELYDMFQNDTSLTSLNLAHWNVAKAKDFYNMFYNDTSLTSLDLTGWQPTAGEQFDHMFAEDAKLASLDVSGWTMANAETLQAMFQDMTTVKALDVSKWAVPLKANVTDMFDGDNALTKLDLTNWRLGTTWGVGDHVFPSYSYSPDPKALNQKSQLQSITFGPLMSGNIAFPQFTLGNGIYGVWRGVSTDKTQVRNAGNANESYVPATTGTKGDTYRFAWDIQAKLVDSQGNPVTLAGVQLTVTNASGTQVATATTGTDGTVDIPLNTVAGSYTVKITGGIDAGHTITKGTATTTINQADGQVALVVDEVHDEDIIKQFPAAGGHGPITLLLSTLLILVGGYGVWRERNF